MALGFLETLRPTSEASSHMAERDAYSAPLHQDRLSLESDREANEQLIIGRPDEAHCMGADVNEEKVAFLCRPE